MKTAFMESKPGSIIKLELERGEAYDTRDTPRRLCLFRSDSSDVHKRVVTERTSNITLNYINK